ncbi:MAG: alpha/beta fold hydrolase [Alcanivorax sp.]|nr:alpha/beta fold hydrolase [Alcanivorax sp.]
MKTISRTSGGLARLLTLLGGEITDTVQEMHGAIAHPLDRGRLPATLVYDMIRYGFRQAGNAVHLAQHALRDEPSPAGHPDLQSIVNGVFGQLLAARDSHYALPMTLLPGPPSLERGTLVLMVHGLCLNEACWDNPAAEAFRQWAGPALDAHTRTLRYNTGLHISENGRDLADLLAATALPERVVLVGHSMGGLVARSALHQGRARGDAWVGRVSHLACLGSPHQGAMLERLGNQANRLLGLTPYSRPLMRLGNLRSDGIRDLRFGYVIEEQWRDRPLDEARPSRKVPLDDRVRQLFLAGSLSEEGSGAPVGDWLVRVDSALAERLYPDAANLSRRLLYRLGHMAMLEDPRTYDCLKEWLLAR